MGAALTPTAVGNIGVSDILIDTCILIDISRNDPTAINRLQKESLSSRLLISTVTEMELLVGCRNKNELQILEQFLLQFIIIPLNQSISFKATQLLRYYYLSHNLLIPDALIAATSIELEVPLLSKNQRDYKFITELNLLPYPSG